MALSILNINVNVSSTSTRFFNVLAADLTVTAGTTIPATDFLTDTGVAATAFPVITNGYYNFYVNGVMQESGTYTVSATELTLNVAGAISAGTPLVLQAVELTTVV